MQPGLTPLHLQAGDHLIELAGNFRVHVSLNYQPSTNPVICFPSPQLRIWFLARPLVTDAARLFRPEKNLRRILPAS
jgi:hypothetical protein